MLSDDELTTAVTDNQLTESKQDKLFFCRIEMKKPHYLAEFSSANLLQNGTQMTSHHVPNLVCMSGSFKCDMVGTIREKMISSSI